MNQEPRVGPGLIVRISGNIDFQKLKKRLGFFIQIRKLLLTKL